MPESSEESTAQPSQANSRPRRRWLQISLRTLLLLIALVAVAALAASWYEAPYRRQREAMAAVERAGGSYQAIPAGPTWLRRLFGPSSFRDVTQVNVADCDDPRAYLDHVAALPSLETLMVGGLAFTDAELERLHGLTTLRGLVLDCTEATDEGIAALHEALPQVEVYRSQRLAILAAGRLGATVQTQSDAAHPELKKLVGSQWFDQAMGNVSFLNGPEVNDADVRLLGKLTSIRLLWIRRGQVTDEGVAHLAPLTNLRQLRLSGTKVGDAGIASLQGMTNLMTLQIDNTRVSDDGAARLTGFKDLFVLDLSGTQVTDAGLARLTTMGRLRMIHLNRTRVGDAGLAHLSALTGLTLLELDHTQVTDAGMTHCRGLQRLQSLSLRNTQVGDDGLAPLDELMLSLLRVGSRVTDAGMRHFKHRTSLRYLHIADTQVTDAGLEYLKGLRGLAEVTLPARISPAAVQALRQALPKCDVRQ